MYVFQKPIPILIVLKKNVWTWAREAQMAHISVPICVLQNKMYIHIVSRMGRVAGTISEGLLLRIISGPIEDPFEYKLCSKKKCSELVKPVQEWSRNSWTWPTCDQEAQIQALRMR